MLLLSGSMYVDQLLCNYTVLNKNLSFFHHPTVKRNLFFLLVAFINSAVLNLLVCTVCLHKLSHTHAYLSAYFL